ncbi:MAG: signal transduction protein [Pseudomonadota bacterium]
MALSNPTRRPIAVLMVAGMFCAVPLSAHAQDGSPLERIQEADANKDGDISWEEVTAMREDMFSRLDRNEDGFVDGDDRGPFGFRNRFKEAVATVTERFDADGDERVSRIELVDAPAPIFETGDVNGDGVLSADEIAELS